MTGVPVTARAAGLSVTAGAPRTAASPAVPVPTPTADGAVSTTATEAPAQAADLIDRRQLQFSLLLPVYRADDASFLRRAFDSATFEQTRRPDEVVIVRDGPVGPELDAELDAIQQRSCVPVAVVNLDSNVGLARALSAGLQACRYDVVARADADDISLPQRFQNQLPLIEAGADLVGSSLLEFDGDENVTGTARIMPTDPAEIARYARFADPFNHPTVVYRRAAVAAVGGYQDLHLMEDYLLFVRMIAGGANVRNVAEPLVKYRVGAGAYHRRGGRRLLRAELSLQRALRRDRFTTRAQYLRNVVVRGGYRLVPVGLRRWAYRSLLLSRRLPGLAR